MIETPQILDVPAQPTAVVHIICPKPAIRDVMGPGYSELMAALAAQGVAPTGPWFTHHLRMDPEVFDFEVGVPVGAPISPAGRVEPGELPAATAARTIYHGRIRGPRRRLGRVSRLGRRPGPQAGDRPLGGLHRRH